MLQGCPSWVSLEQRFRRCCLTEGSYHKPFPCSARLMSSASQ